MSAIQVARWGDMVKRLLALKGPENLQQGRELVSAIVLENDRPEWRRSTGARIGYLPFVLAAGGAGTRTSGQLWVPRDTGILVTLRRVIVATTTANAIIQLGWNSTALTTLGNVLVHGDLRNVSNITFSQGFGVEARNEATAGTKISRLIVAVPVLTQTTTQLHLDLIMGDRTLAFGGTGLVIEATQDQVNLYGAFEFEERAIDRTADG